MPSNYTAILPSLVENKQELYQHIFDSYSNQKRSTNLLKRYFAFVDIVYDWVEEQAPIGQAILEGICLVGHYHKTLFEIEQEKDKKQKEQELTEALDYFQGLLGNSFRLIK